MEVVHARCAGIDISKRDAKVCVRIQGSGSRATTSAVTTWGSTSRQVLALREHLISEKVTCVVMESTGDYWKPFFYLLEDGLNVMLANPSEARNRPGRKTDVSDAAWLADLAAHGLLRASLIPPPPIRRLRDLTRARTNLHHDRARHVLRIEKILEDAGIKLSSVASDIMGKSGRAMLGALIIGGQQPDVIADLAVGRMRSRTTALTEALTGRFTAHHGYLVQMQLDLADACTNAIADLDARINNALVESSLIASRELLCSIPGFSTTVAEIFLAETGADMTVFATGGHLASWAGVCPGANESAGRVKSSKTRPGNRHLKAALGIASLSVSRSKGTYFAAKYRRINTRRGPMKALVAVQRAMIVAAHSMLTHGDFYRDPGADYFISRTPGQTKNRAVRQLEVLGFKVELSPLPNTA